MPEGVTEITISEDEIEEFKVATASIAEPLGGSAIGFEAEPGLFQVPPVLILTPPDASGNRNMLLRAEGQIASYAFHTRPVGETFKGRHRNPLRRGALEIEDPGKTSHIWALDQGHGGDLADTTMPGLPSSDRKPQLPRDELLKLTAYLVANITPQPSEYNRRDRRTLTQRIRRQGNNYLAFSHYTLEHPAETKVGMIVPTGETIVEVEAGTNKILGAWTFPFDRDPTDMPTDINDRLAEARIRGSLTSHLKGTGMKHTVGR